MSRVIVELWLWLGRELKGDFESPSEMRSIKEEVVEEGTTIGDLLKSLANRYQPIRQRVFDIEDRRLRDDVVITLNDRVTPPQTVLEQILRDGDKITIVPVYTGG